MILAVLTALATIAVPGSNLLVSGPGGAGNKRPEAQEGTEVLNPHSRGFLSPLSGFLLARGLGSAGASNATLVAKAPVTAAASDAAPAPVAVTAPVSSLSKAIKFTLDPARKVYEVGVNFAYQTTVWTPVNCGNPAVGDPEYFAVLTPDTTARRFILAAKVEKPGAKTNVTFACDEGVRFSVEATQVPQDKAVLIVEFELNADESERVRAVVESERKAAKEQCDARVDDLKESLEKEAQDALARGLLRRFSADHDAEAARERFVVVHVRRELLIGGKGYILFDVQNLSSKDVSIRDVEVLAETGNAAMDNVTLVMPERRVGPNATSPAVATFDAPDDISTVVLVVHEDGPRTIRVEDVDF
jgi:hypothetical protein